MGFPWNTLADSRAAFSRGLELSLLSLCASHMHTSTAHVARLGMFLIMFIVEEDKGFYSIFHPKGLILKNRIWGQFLWVLLWLLYSYELTFHPHPPTGVTASRMTLLA